MIGDAYAEFAGPPLLREEKEHMNHNNLTEQELSEIAPTEAEATGKLLADYLRQISAVAIAESNLYNLKDALVGWREERLTAELQYVVNDLECASYIALGSNETARKDRRSLWMLEHLGKYDTAIKAAEREVLSAETTLELAKHRLTWLRLALEPKRDRDA